MAGEGQKTQTKSRSIETGVNGRIKRSVWRYRTAYRAHLELDPTGDWKNEYRELRDEDNRGPLKEGEEIGTGDGRYTPSWIWTSSATTLPGEGTVAEQQEINETARHEWMTCRARADRWIEEVELLKEEMRRVLFYLEWKSTSWLQKVGIRTGSCTVDIQRGIDAYARRQAAIYRDLAISFASRWLPYLKASDCETPWAADLPWVSEALSLETKLPKWFPTVSADTPHSPPTAGSSQVGSVEGPEPMQQPLNADGAQSEGITHPNGAGNTSRDGDDEEEESDEYRGYDHPDYNNEGCGEEEEGCNDNGDGRDDGAETDNELGFEYDDEYMS